MKDAEQFQNHSVPNDNQFTKEEVEAAKVRKEIILAYGEDYEKTTYMAGEICMWDEMRYQLPNREIDREKVMNEFSEHLKKSIFFGDSMRKLIFEHIDDYLKQKENNMKNETNNNGFVKRPNNNILIEIAAWGFLGLIVVFILVCTGVVRLRQEHKTTPQTNIAVKSDTVAYDSVLVSVSVYNPTIGQCDSTPLICADGSIIDPLHPKRWVGASRDIVDIVGYGNTINLKIPQAPYFDGEWFLHDTDNGKLTKHIDILISNPDVCYVRGKWDGYILYFK